MEVFTTMKYRKQLGSNNSGLIKIYFPKKIKITREIKLESFASLGDFSLSPLMESIVT